MKNWILLLTSNTFWSKPIFFFSALFFPWTWRSARKNERYSLTVLIQRAWYAQRTLFILSRHQYIWNGTLHCWLRTARTYNSVITAKKNTNSIFSCDICTFFLFLFFFENRALSLPPDFFFFFSASADGICTPSARRPTFRLNRLFCCSLCVITVYHGGLKLKLISQLPSLHLIYDSSTLGEHVEMDFMKLFGTVIAVLFHPGSASKLNGKNFLRSGENSL